MIGDLDMESMLWTLARGMQMRRSVRLSSSIVVAFLMLNLGKARADTDGPCADAARALYQGGLELFDRGEHLRALQAFNDAYAACPNFAVLYNIGQVQIALGRPVEASATLARYLHDGQDQVPPEKRRPVEDQIKQLDALLVELDVTAAPSGAVISLDGREIGHTPLSAPVRVTAGTHKITAILDDGTIAAQSTAVGSGQGQDVCPQAPNPMPIIESAKPIPARSGLRVAVPYIFGGAGLALGGGALGIYLWKRSEYHRWQAGEAALQNETPASPDYQMRVADNHRMADSLTTANHAILGLAIAGGVMVATGGALYLVDKASARTASTFAIAWTGGSSVAASWRCLW
jgi:tetratricopeptide (TPR) repeat protein